MVTKKVICSSSKTRVKCFWNSGSEFIKPFSTGPDLSDLWLPVSWWMEEEVITECYFDIKVCLFINVCFDFYGNSFLEPFSARRITKTLLYSAKSLWPIQCFLLLQLNLLCLIQQPHRNEKCILNWNCILHHSFIYSAQMGRSYRSKCHLLYPLHFFLPSNALHYAFICLRDAIVVYELGYLGLWSACSGGTPPAAHNKWDVA